MSDLLVPRPPETAFGDLPRHRPVKRENASDDPGSSHRVLLRRD
ncbi:MAG: hypothetical protein VX694_00245 [Planctomycetota bacterium]|nr:hypothetical protein [Planctomycetota bacterium]